MDRREDAQFQWRKDNPWDTRLGGWMSSDQERASDAGRSLHSQRPRVTIQCEVCGEQVERLVASGHQKPRTCGPTCRARLYRLRQKTPTN